MTRALALVLCLATTAHADVWQRAIDTTDVTKDHYEEALRNGDELAQRAVARSQSLAVVTSEIDQAIRAYRDAAAARPDQGEPYFRIASVLESFYTDCEPRGLGVARPPTCPANRTWVDPARAKATVEAWDEFEKRAPLDPRLAEALFSRAILRTKLVESSNGAKAYLEGAMRDYNALLDRSDGLTMIRMEQVYGNLAETYMMLGRLDQAIDAYGVAIEQGGTGSTYYGKAVALDRDERETEALEVIRSQGIRSFEDFQMQFASGDVFFVPKGEEFYYFALINEAFGYTPESIANWRLFIKSKAHPQFQARAKAHLDALLIKQRTNPRPPQRPDVIDLFP